MRIGTAGWVISREASESFPGEGQHLQRYARVFRCTEINSSFRRSHRTVVYERWAAQTPDDFRFSVKVPRAITHEAQLRTNREAVDRFLAEVSGLGQRLEVVLLQFPPSYPFEAKPLRSFLKLLRERYRGSVVCEPRHQSWFSREANDELIALRVSRAAADPVRWPEAARPGGWLGAAGDGVGAVLYYRWHGSPRTYWSRYDSAWLRERVAQLTEWPVGADCWCIFDNTASGAAIANAAELQALFSHDLAG